MYVGRLLELSGTSSKSVSSAEKTTTTCEIEHETAATVFNCHKNLTESLDVIQIANTFAGRNENRMKNFGIFTNADL